MAKNKPSPTNLISARELAEAADEEYNTIDHWTTLSLLPCLRRGRKRLYSKEDSLHRCKRIRDLQNQGHTLITIRGMLASGR